MHTATALGFVAALVLLCTSTTADAVPATTPTRAVYPLKVGPTHRYLVDQRGRPFMIVGDSPQALFVNLSLRDATTFIANRAAAGFNSLWVNLLCAKYTGGREDGSTYDHIAPFRKAGDLSTPNEQYFKRVDAMVRLAGRYGIVVFLDPIETGGWLSVLQANGPAKAFAYGRYLGKRYAKFPNIVWMSGNDFQNWKDPSSDALVLAVARGIRSTDHRHIHTVELNYTVSSSLDDARWRPVIGLDAAYTYNATYAEVLKEYNQRRFMPVFMVEAGYEDEQNSSSISPGVPNTLRRQEYWTMLSGATGQLYGDHSTWQFLPDWKSHLDTPGTKQMGYLVKLFAGRPWYRLVPDQKHTLLTSGYGTFSSDGNVQSSDYATAARTPDGRLAIAYLPTVRTVTIDTSKLAGDPMAQWYDPSAGTYAPAVPTAKTGSTQTFRPPDKNKDGDGDWVLVLTAGSR
ncbi:MAG TPA: DUF4038 domain-containing protein [Gaiellaceae bacterium]|nr:DUF4038 domain-containing protein [Gaiellaceae bacterium]